MRRVLVVGASSVIVKHCCRLWANEMPTHFLLVGRNADKLNQVAAELTSSTTQTSTEVIVTDLIDVHEISRVTHLSFAKHIDIAIVAHGYLPIHMDATQDLHLAQKTLEINGVSPSLWAEAIANHMEKTSGGTLVVIGSVAGDRGRASNYVYGSGKGMLERFVEGLQHRFRGTALRVVLVKPGPTNTPMHATVSAKGPVAQPERVAKGIVRAAKRGTRVVYVPRYWWLIMLVIRAMPFRLFSKLPI